MLGGISPYTSPFPILHISELTVFEVDEVVHSVRAAAKDISKHDFDHTLLRCQRYTKLPFRNVKSQASQLSISGQSEVVAVSFFFESVLGVPAGDRFHGGDSTSQLGHYICCHCFLLHAILGADNSEV
jgi:hypothetical protein